MEAGANLVRLVILDVYKRRKTFSDLRASISLILDQRFFVVFVFVFFFVLQAVPSAKLIRTSGGEWSLKSERAKIRKKKNAHILQTISQRNSYLDVPTGHSKSYTLTFALLSEKSISIQAHLLLKIHSESKNVNQYFLGNVLLAVKIWYAYIFYLPLKKSLWFLNLKWRLYSLETRINNLLKKGKERKKSKSQSFGRKDIKNCSCFSFHSISVEACPTRD